MTTLPDSEHFVDNQSRSGTLAPQRSEDFAHLSLAGLRQYRQALTQEEGRVSYWRRILQARLDVVQAGHAGVGDTEHLRPMLAERTVTGGRRALIDVVPRQDFPPLPDLERLWARQVTPDDPEASADLVQELVRAESELSAYRGALHRRLALATGELIARYREDPSLCLTALPVSAPRRAVAR